MERMADLIQSGDFAPYRNTTKRTVEQLLHELGLEGKVFTILVNGKRADLSDELEVGAEIVVLPKIAGGRQERGE